MYQEFKRKQEAEEREKEKEELGEENFYRFNLNSTRIFFLLIFSLFGISLIFLFGYWVGKIKGEINEKMVSASIKNERKMVSKLLPPETSQINLKDESSHENSIPKRYGREKSIDFNKDFSNKNPSLDLVKKITKEAVLKFPKKTTTLTYQNEKPKGKESYKKSSSTGLTTTLTGNKKVSRLKKSSKKGMSFQSKFKKGYQVQVSANRNQKYALELKNKLITKGYHAYITKKKTAKNFLYIVSIGPFTNMKDAKDTKAFLLKDFLNLQSAYIFKY